MDFDWRRRLRALDRTSTIDIDTLTFQAEQDVIEPGDIAYRDCLTWLTGEPLPKWVSPRHRHIVGRFWQADQFNTRRKYLQCAIVIGPILSPLLHFRQMPNSKFGDDIFIGQRPRHSYLGSADKPHGPRMIAEAAPKMTGQDLTLM